MSGDREAEQDHVIAVSPTIEAFWFDSDGAVFARFHRFHPEQLLTYLVGMESTGMERIMQRKALLSIIAVGALVAGQSALSTTAQAQGHGWARHSGAHVGFRGPGPRFGAYAGPRYGYRNYGWRSSAWVPAAVAGATIGVIGAAAAAPYYYDDYAYPEYDYAYYNDNPDYAVGYTYGDVEPVYPAYGYAYSYPGYAYAPTRRVVYRTGYAPYRTYYRSGYAYRPTARTVRYDSGVRYTGQRQGYYVRSAASRPGYAHRAEFRAQARVHPSRR